MTIAKADILSFINEAVEASYAGTDIDTKIQVALEDLSQMHCLLAEDTTQSLTSGSFYLPYPTNALNTDQAIQSVVLTGSSGATPPLKQIPGGWDAYSQLMEVYSSASGGVSEWMVCHASRIYVYPQPDGTYPAKIWYYKFHPALALGIEFPNEWANALKFGTAYFIGLLGGDDNLMNRWEPRYFAEKERCRLRIPRDLSIVGA
jgi:hypothetical protein